MIDKYGLDEPLPAAVPHLPEEHRHARLRRLLPVQPAGAGAHARPALADPRAGRARRRSCRSSSASGSAPSPPGTAAASSTRSRRPRTITLYSMPEWWLGLILFFLFSTGLRADAPALPDRPAAIVGRRPVVARRRRSTRLAPGAAGVTLTLAYLAEYSLIMRSALLDEMGEDYLQTARAKGLARRARTPSARHAQRPPAGRHAGLAQPRLHRVAARSRSRRCSPSRASGLLTTDALRIPDIPMLQGTFFVFSAAVVIANLVSNLLYGFLDPRVRI